MKRKSGKAKVTDRFRASNGYVIEWAPDPDIVIPEATNEEFKLARPARDVLPQAFFDAWKEMKRLRGRPKSPKKKLDIKLRIDPDIVAAFKATGKGWQTRMNDALRKQMRYL